MTQPQNTPVLPTDIYNNEQPAGMLFRRVVRYILFDVFYHDRIDFTDGNDVPDEEEERDQHDRPRYAVDKPHDEHGRRPARVDDLGRKRYIAARDRIKNIFTALLHCGNILFLSHQSGVPRIIRR